MGLICVVIYFFGVLSINIWLFIYTNFNSKYILNSMWEDDIVLQSFIWPLAILTICFTVPILICGITIKYLFKKSA